MQARPPDFLRRLTLALIALEALATGIDLAAGPHAVLHWEERVNARNGALFACGHLEHWAALQYRTFCGGCTTEGLLVAPIYRLLGVTVGAWKLGVVGIHLAVVGASAALARRLAGWGAAAVTVLLLATAPGFYREQVLTGWGNHAEASLFPLLAALWLGRGALGAGAAGLALGFGTWFAPITAHAAPALAWLAARSRRDGAMFAGGAALGLLPLAAFLRARPAGVQETEALWTGLSPAIPAELWGLLSGQGIGGGLWSPFEYGDVATAGLVLWGLLWLLGVLGAGLQARQGQPLRGLLGWALGGLLVAYALRHDLWQHLPEFPDHPTFNLRYLAPLVPWLALGAGVTATASGRLRTPARVGLAVVLLGGGGLRLSSWQGWHPERLAVPVVTRAERLDRTMPLGDPPQPNRQQQGRPQDLRAGLDWLQAHDDGLEACRAVHAAELGRRLGRAADPGPWIQDASAVAQTPETRALLIDGLARALGSPDDLAGRLAALGSLADAVGHAWGRIHATEVRGRSPQDLGASWPPAVVDGVCEARRAHATDPRSGLRPGWHADDPGDADGCPDPSRQRR